MKLQILQIADAGVPNQERLHLRVLEPTNLSYHLVVSSAWVTLTTVANGAKSVFWFPPQDVKTGDEIVLYTRGGAQESKAGLLGSTTYFYFWGEKSTLWNAENSCALVFDVATWGATINRQALALAQQFNLPKSSSNDFTTLLGGADSHDTNNFLTALGGARQTKQSNSLLDALEMGSSANKLAQKPSEQETQNALAKALRDFGLTHPPTKDDDDDSPFGKG
jgi:hypothetical protein